jgi:menaquinone-9 beta-reductase
VQRTRYDLVIVGGGPAGISLALHLQRCAPALAEATVVLERARYPRDKYCAGAIGNRGLMCLEAIGARPDVPAVPLGGITFAFGGRTHTVRLPALGCVVRRLEFDQALARIAVARGVAVREGTEVRGIELHGSGARVHLAGGGVLETRAVAGADGVRGVTRRTTGFSRGRLRAQVVELDTEICPGDLPRDTLRFDFSDRRVPGYVWDFPTLVDGRPLMCRGAYVVGGDGVSPRAYLARHLESKGLDIGHYRLKPFAERGLDRTEPIARPHLVLVGEAAGIDLATGEGIPQALAFGALGAGYLAACFQKGDLRFQDWGPWLLAAREGRLIRHRHLAARYLFSSERAQIERLGQLDPALLEIGMRRFAGQPTPLPLALRAVAAFLRWSIAGGALALHRARAEVPGL